MWQNRSTYFPMSLIQDRMSSSASNRFLVYYPPFSYHHLAGLRSLYSSAAAAASGVLSLPPPPPCGSPHMVATSAGGNAPPYHYPLLSPPPPPPPPGVTQFTPWWVTRLRFLNSVFPCGCIVFSKSYRIVFLYCIYFLPYESFSYWKEFSNTLIHPSQLNWLNLHGGAIGKAVSGFHISAFTSVSLIRPLLCSCPPELKL